MVIFEMVKYHNKEYPDAIPLRVEECAAHFDITNINATLDLSLHTEYSYGRRRFDSEIINRFPILAESNKKGVPQLWRSSEWGEQFADFVIALAGDRIPQVVEIHPPFSDYADIAGFVDSYVAFENVILERFPSLAILVENRCGTIYRGGKFVLSTLDDICSLCEEIDKRHLSLRIAYDIPQIYTAHNAKTYGEYLGVIERTREFSSYVGGVHLWGKKKGKSGRLVSHCGDLNSFFDNDSSTKDHFLREFTNCFDDNTARKMVLEVNSCNNDLLSIIDDLIKVGVKFV